MIKTRFPPSPTGDLHIGSLRTALYNYLFAKKNNGQFLLRIEDTDRERYQEGSVENILESLEWTGLKWDCYKSEIRNPKSETNPKSKIQNPKDESREGIIFQSSRLDVYQKYANELVAKGNAYYCFCSEETLEQMRQEQVSRGEAPKYDRRCLKLSQTEVEEKLKRGEPHVIRMKVPEKFQTGFSQVKNAPKGAGNLIFTDLIRGQVKFALKDLDDQILLKSDGFPTYHLANVVDDHEMQITHVIRAEEWLPSTPKHIILYNFFDWELPEFAHIPLVLSPDKSKLSKRHGAVSVLEFKKLGYLSEALINYLALLGWNPGDDREIFTLQELEKEFSLEKVQKAGAVFDINKLDWMNGYYIRQMDLDKLTELCLPYFPFCHSEEPRILRGDEESLKHDMPPRDYIKKIVALEQERLKKLSDIVELTAYFFKEVDYEAELLKWKKSDLKTAKERLEFLVSELSKVPEENWTRSALEEFIKDLIEAHKLGMGETLWPMRLALTGRDKSPGPFEVAEVLGREECLLRLKVAAEKIKIGPTHLSSRTRCGIQKTS